MTFGHAGENSRRKVQNVVTNSTADLQEKLMIFIDYFNQTFAKPFNWTYIGKPTKSNADRRPRTWRENTQTKKSEQIIALVA